MSSACEDDCLMREVNARVAGPEINSPGRVDTLEQQLERAYSQYRERQSDIHKNSFLQSMKGEG
jgi:hypothetical protein